MQSIYKCQETVGTTTRAKRNAETWPVSNRHAEADGQHVKSYLVFCVFGSVDDIQNLSGRGHRMSSPQPIVSTLPPERTTQLAVFRDLNCVNGIAASSFCCLHSGFVHNAQIRWKAAIFLFVGSLQRFPPSIDIEQVLESFWLVFHRISLRRFARLWLMGSLLRLPDFVSIFRGPELGKIDMVGAIVTSRSALLVAVT